LTNFLFGLLVGIVITGIGFLFWTWAILREERRIADRTACTPDWCPMVIDTEQMTEEEIESMPCCSKPHEHD